MEMHMVLASTVTKKIYHKTFVVKHVFSYLYNYLPKNYIMQTITIFERI